MSDSAPPRPPDDLGAFPAKLQELYYAALLERWKAEAVAHREEQWQRWKLGEQRRDARVAAEGELRATVHAAYLDVATASLERSLKRANFVTAGAGAIATSYTGLLALVFSVKGNAAHPMPAPGIGPVLFLGLALMLSVAYAAFLSDTRRPGRFLTTGVGTPMQEKRMITFITWVSRGVYARVWALRLSVESLGIGVALMPIPFLDMPDPAQWKLVGLGGGGLAIGVLVEVALSQWKRRKGGDSEDWDIPPAEAVE